MSPSAGTVYDTEAEIAPFIKKEEARRIAANLAEEVRLSRESGIIGFGELGKAMKDPIRLPLAEELAERSVAAAESLLPALKAACDKADAAQKAYADLLDGPHVMQVFQRVEALAAISAAVAEQSLAEKRYRAAKAIADRDADLASKVYTRIGIFHDGAYGTRSYGNQGRSRNAVVNVWGIMTEKIIASRVLQNSCGKCSRAEAAAKALGPDAIPVQHEGECHRNWHKGPNTLEGEALRQLIGELKAAGVVVAINVQDGDVKAAGIIKLAQLFASYAIKCVGHHGKCMYKSLVKV